MKFAKFLLAAALMMSGVAASAQDTERVEFKSHAFIDAKAGANYVFGTGKMSKQMTLPNFYAGIGYQFNPWFAARIGANFMQAKSGFDKKLGAAAEDAKYQWNYIGVPVDLKFNLINAFAGYNPNRWFGLNAILGGGVNILTKNKEALNYAPTYNAMAKAWEGTKFTWLGRAGLDLDFRLADWVSFNLEAIMNVTDDKFDSKKSTDSGIKALDYYVTALAGFRFNLGATKTVIPVVVPVVVEEPAPEPAPVVVKETPKPQPVVKKAPEMQTEIFYAIRQTVITESEQAKVANLINFLKANPETKVTVTGYADAGTGNAKINMKYSEQRAENVAKALTEAGIDAARITVDAKGDTVQPFAENDKNRVTIAIAK